jgi:hypothetical protein
MCALAELSSAFVLPKSAFRRGRLFIQDSSHRNRRGGVEMVAMPGAARLRLVEHRLSLGKIGLRLVSVHLYAWALDGHFCGAALHLPFKIFHAKEIQGVAA